MKLRVLSVLAVAVLLAACETAPETTVATTEQTEVTPPPPPPAPTDQGPVAGSFEDFVQSAGGTDRIFFDYDSSDIRPDASQTLRLMATWLQQYPNRQVTIEGHCDERGTREYNLALGERRANSVRDFLIAQGVPGSRINTISYGKERPAVPGSTEFAWSQNRRGVIVFR